MKQQLQRQHPFRFHACLGGLLLLTVAVGSLFCCDDRPGSRHGGAAIFFSGLNRLFVSAAFFIFFLASLTLQLLCWWRARIQANCFTCASSTPSMACNHAAGLLAATWKSWAALVCWAAVTKSLLLIWADSLTVALASVSSIDISGHAFVCCLVLLFAGSETYYCYLHRFRTCWLFVPCAVGAVYFYGMLVGTCLYYHHYWDKAIGSGLAFVAWIVCYVCFERH